MLPQQRRERILLAVRATGAVRAAELVDELGVSEMTIRRDISELASRGLLRKVHGGAVHTQPTVHEPAFATKMGLALSEKTRIAEAAADLIEPGSAIALSAGTTTNALARIVASRHDLRPLTVVTNSLQVTDTLFNAPGELEVVLIGGSRTPSDALVGPVAVGALGQLRVDLLFLGVHGMDESAGLTTPNLLEAETNRKLIRSAGRTVVLADSSKWGTVGLSQIAPFSGIDVLVTDAGLSEEAVTVLDGAVGRLIVVPLESTQGTTPIALGAGADAGGLDS